MKRLSTLDGHQQPQLPADHYLDNRIYTDENVFKSEQQNILGSSWRFACHASEIPDKLSYRLIQCGPHELILVRGEDEEVRCFYNSCAHRGARVLREPAGKLDQGRMTCFYHLWSFDSIGRCINVSQPAAYQGTCVSKENIGLKSVRVDSVYDLIFVCLDNDAESLQDFLGEEVVEAMRVPFGSVELDVFHFHRTEVKANWKLFVETNCEGYHELLHLLNRTTAVAEQDYRSRQWRFHRNGHLSFDLARIGYENLNYEQRQEHVFPGMENNGHVVVNLFPDMMLNCRSTVVRIDSLIPISAERTILECRGLGIKGDSPEARSMRIRHHNQVWGPTGINLAEDLWAVESQMQNMRDGSSHYSVIAREEQGPMSDSSLRSFYTLWSQLTGYQQHDITQTQVGN